MMTAGKAGFTARKAQFLNMSKDGLKIRASQIQSKKSYSRTKKHKNQTDW
jgi:hypothetical protein